MTRDAVVMRARRIVMRRIHLFRKYLHIPYISAAEKSACPDGKELSIGCGMSGAIPPAIDIGLSRHCGIPRLRMLYMTNTLIIVKKMRSAFFLYSSFFFLTHMSQSAMRKSAQNITTDSQSICMSIAYSDHTSDRAEMRSDASSARSDCNICEDCMCLIPIFKTKQKRILTNI